LNDKVYICLKLLLRVIEVPANALLNFREKRCKLSLVHDMRIVLEIKRDVRCVAGEQ